MKRSEMVILMIDEMERWQDKDAKFGGGWRAMMSSILEKQLEAGMLPAPHNVCIFTRKPKERGEAILYEWELEGE